MRFLSLLLILPLAALAEDPAVPEKKKDDPSSPTNKVDQWEATKGNDDLYKAETKDATVGVQVAVETGSGVEIKTKDAVNQNESIVLQANILTSCLDTSLNGRTDELCKSSPTHPECMGFNVALENSICSTPGYVPKDDTECKQPNLKDYSADEWWAFGQQYYAGMQQCGTMKIKAPGTSTMKSLTEMVKDGKTTKLGDSAVSKSDVSGTVPPQANGALPAAAAGASVMKKVTVPLTTVSVKNDGSARLGYDNGELIKRAENGDSFYSVVMNSPAIEAIKEEDRTLVEHGLLEPSLVLDKARTAGRLPALGENLDQYRAATAEKKTEKPAEKIPEKVAEKKEAPAPAPVAAAAPPAKVEEAKAPEVAAEPAKPASPTGPGVSAVVVAAEAPALIPVAELLPEAKPAEEKEARPLMLAERIARLEAAAHAALKIKEAGGRAPASLPSIDPPKPLPAKVDAELDKQSLFERVSHAYRRKGPALVSRLP